MRAEISKGYTDGFNRSHRKETHFAQQFSGVAVSDGKLMNVVDAKIYETPTRAYACLWVYAPGDFDLHLGSASASGGNCHLASYALGKAIKNAGISLSETIACMGDTAIEEAIRAIVSAIYPDSTAYVLNAHP